MNIKPFFIGLILAYVSLSLPSMLGIIICWAPEVTFLQKVKGYVVTILLDNFVIKFAFSILWGMICSFIFTRYRRSQLSY